MIVVVPNCMCTGKPDPREWEYEGRSGTSYKVEISDGNSTVQFPVTEDVYPEFEPFERFNVTLNIEQTDFDGRKGVRCRVIDCEPV